ncbi:MAG: substrate-binding domain-containing protein [Spirochaetes bacterium]|nr:substrate-binding domain-containing protein [Spirochaetota bacterium]
MQLSKKRNSRILFYLTGFLVLAVLVPFVRLHTPSKVLSSQEVLKHDSTKDSPVSAGHSILRMATTTSVESSHLLDTLLPVFTQGTGIRVDVVAVGTGAALALGRNGDVDILLVHAPELEEQFIEEGHGVFRTTFLYNEFLLVGPQNDPAGVRTALTIQDCFIRIAQARAPFLSRGDNSGTHVREKEIWKKAGIYPEGSWYREVGQGMESLLRMASDLGSYTVTDSATWAYLKGKLLLNELYRNKDDPFLQNFYSLILVHPERHPRVAFSTATLFLEWITSPEVLQRIQCYTIGGEQVFFPVSTRLP